MIIPTAQVQMMPRNIGARQDHEPKGRRGVEDRYRATDKDKNRAQRRASCCAKVRAWCPTPGSSSECPLWIASEVRPPSVPFDYSKPRQSAFIAWICQSGVAEPGEPPPLVTVPLMNQINTCPVVVLRQRMSLIPSPL